MDFSLKSSSQFSGLVQLVKTQSTIDRFFMKKRSEEGRQSKKRETTSQIIQVKEDEWICDRCTLINSISIQYCEVCGSKRQTKRSALRCTEVGIDTMLGKGKEKTKCKVPSCLKHNLPCTRHQGNDCFEIVNCSVERREE